MYHYFKIRYSVLLLRKRAGARLDLRLFKKVAAATSARPSSCAELVLQAADYSPGKVPVLFCPYSERKKIQLETVKFANLVCTCSSIPVLKSRYRY